MKNIYKALQKFLSIKLPYLFCAMLIIVAAQVTEEIGERVFIASWVERI